VDYWTGLADELNHQGATAKRFHYDSHDWLRRHLDDLISPYNFARRLKTLKGLTPSGYICSVWTSDPSGSDSILTIKRRA
jgi:hypothetical protein